MHDEKEQEITSKKVTHNSNTPVNGYRVSEERTTKVNNDGISGAVVFTVILFFAVGGGAVAYFLNNCPSTTPILVPSAVDTVRENKSTVIERNNTTVKEVSPATVQPTPKVEVTVQPQPAAPAPAITVTAQPVAPAPAVTVTAQPTATPSTTPKAATPSAKPNTGFLKN